MHTRLRLGDLSKVTKLACVRTKTQAQTFYVKLDYSSLAPQRGVKLSQDQLKQKER